jgi:hypothetical protein
LGTRNRSQAPESSRLARGASVTLFELARAVNPTVFFPFAKTYYNPVTIARDIFPLSRDLPTP